MKKLKIFPKMFIQIFSVLGIIIILVHSLVFFIFPKTYLETRKEKIYNIANEISSNMNGKEIKYIEQTLELYSKSSEIKAFIKEENNKNEIQIKDNINVNLESDSNSLIIEEREIKLNDGKKINLQFVSTADMQRDAKDLSLKFLPYSLLISILFSAIISLIYAKSIKNNLQEIKIVTDKMMKLDKKTRLKVSSNDEVGELKQQINDLYSTLLRTIDDLEFKNKEILKLEKLKYDFFKGASHELKTPLASLKIILENMKYNIGKYKERDIYINECIEIVDSLTKNISQILSVHSIENLNNDEEYLKINDTLEDILKKYEILANQKKITVNNYILDENIYIGKTALKIILSNLISNAIKYTSEGEINLILRSADDGGNQYTEIIVSDTGYGIDAEALPHIFDRYYQAKGKHQASGTGIGLALVKSLADLHEGTLQVESEIGKGTTFTFRLLTENTYPNALHREEKETLAQEETEIAETVEEEKEEADTRPVVLVVEDNDDIREYIATSFSSNYRILTATNGKEGLEQAQKYIPDIIISDIMMPEMDGIELCKLVKEDIRTSHIPVILLTAKDSIQDKEEGYESGADSYLTKPFSAKLLNSRVHNLLESRKKLALIVANRTKELKPEQQEETIKLNKLDEEFLTKFTTIVEENIDMEKMDMSFMMEKMNMSHSTLYRKIKSLTGMSGNELIRKIRLKNSLRLLMEEGHNISEAAYASGFNDLGYFRSCFREEYGMAPSEYIKQTIRTKE